MAKFTIVIICCALCCIFNRASSAPMIKASGVQWSEPKGTGKGNITLIMIPQNNSCGNDTDMIVAVKSDYQIVSQDTQLLNLVVNENRNNKTNTSKFDTSLQKCSNVKDDGANKQEVLRQPNTAKYFEPENKLPSENTTNNTVNIYPLLVKNYQNLVSLNGTSTTAPYTVNVFQLLNMSASNNKQNSLSNVKMPNDSHLNTATSNYNSYNLTETSNPSLIANNIVKSTNGNVSQTVVGSDDNFLNEALNIIEKLKKDPSYYNNLKSNQIPSTEEIKEHGDLSLADSKTKFLKSDDSALASDEGLGQEYINHENQDISNLEGNVNEHITKSTCVPFFMPFSSEQTTTKVDLNNQTAISFEQVPLRGTGSNVSQEFSAKCKPLTPNNAFGGISQTPKPPVEIYANVVSVGYGVQSNITVQTLAVTKCKPSNGLVTESPNAAPLTVATSQTEYRFGAAESVSKGEPDYIQQTLAAAKIAIGLELSITESPHNFAVTANIPVSGYENSLTKNQTECVTPTKCSETVMAPNLEQANKAPAAAGMKSLAIPENQLIKTPQPEVPVTKMDPSLPSSPSVLFDGSTPQNLLNKNELETKSTECIANNQLQTLSPNVVPLSSTISAAAGLNGLAEMQTECVTDPSIKEDVGVPKAAVGAILKKITLEPQLSCGTLKKEESCTLSHIENQEVFIRDKDLTLPLVKSSIFLANNNDMPKGNDIPISLNASLDEFSLSDLQEKDDRMHGKVAELYNHNPIIFNVESEPTGEFLKPQLKYYKNEVLKSPTLYFDKVHNPDSNQILRMKFAGKNLILEQRPSYKSETNKVNCNNTQENYNKLTNYEIEPVDSDSINVKPEPMSIITTAKIITLSKSNGENEQKYLATNTKLSDTQQPANEEDKLRTILNTDKTTTGVKSYDRPQDYSTLPDIISTIPSRNEMVSIPMPVSDDKVLNPKESGENDKNANSTLGQRENENTNLQLNNLFNLTTKEPYSSKKPRPTGKLPGRVSSKPSRTKTNNVKTVPDFSKTGSSDNTDQGKNTPNKDKMCIPGDSVQKIVIEIVRATNKPKNKKGSTTSDNNDEGFQNMEETKEKIPYNELNNIKQNFVSFQSAWKPAKTLEKQQVFPLNYSKKPIKDNLKTETYESDDEQDTKLENKNSNTLFENQDTYKQEQNPTVLNEYNSPFQQTATNHEKNLGANILKLLMADKPVVKRE